MPVFPDKVIVPLLAPIHSVLSAGARVPPAATGSIVTTWVVVAGPLQPAALAVMVVVPLHPAA